MLSSTWRRGANHIDEAFEVFRRETAACVISVYEPRHSPAKAYKVNADRTIGGLVSDSAPYARRQDLPFLMTPTESVDIHTPEDFALAAQLLETSHG
jgi:CMP-N,N'-diacetyllegionaminic acid synthase